MKMVILALQSLISLTIVLQVLSTGDEKQICLWRVGHRQTKCPKDQYQCLNSDKCIQRSWYCDGGNDCGDNSDEKYCDTSNPCPTDPLFIRCQNSRKCIPYEFLCNGFTDCPQGEDENNCGKLSQVLPFLTQSINTRPAIANIDNWLRDQRLENSVEKWGSSVDRIALIFYFIDENFFLLQDFWRNATRNEIAYELSIQLLSRLASMELREIPSTELASFLNAFLVVCVNPRNFHGYDIVQELRNQVDRENYTSPYVLLALCNAGEIITETDKKKLLDTFSAKHRPFWTDMQAVVVMALVCASRQSGNEVDVETLSGMVLELKQRQYRNGTVVNLPTTALVMQALIAINSESDPDNFDEMKAMQELLQSQKSDGSFGDLMTTLLVAPVLSCKSLVDINSNHCHYESRDEISALESLSKRAGPKIHVQYSLWIGNEKDLERNLVLRVPQNKSFYGVMELAAEVDTRFKFDYTVKDRKPYINAISGMRDNPLMENFWFLYIVQDGKPTLLNESPADIMPKDNDHYVMWYKKGTWVN